MHRIHRCDVSIIAATWGGLGHHTTTTPDTTTSPDCADQPISDCKPELHVAARAVLLARGCPWGVWWGFIYIFGRAMYHVPCLIKASNPGDLVQSCIANNLDPPAADYRAISTDLFIRISCPRIAKIIHYRPMYIDAWYMIPGITYRCCNR